MDTMEGLWTIYLTSWSFGFPFCGNGDDYHNNQYAQDFSLSSIAWGAFPA